VHFFIFVVSEMPESIFWSLFNIPVVFTIKLKNIKTIWIKLQIRLQCHVLRLKADNLMKVSSFFLVL